MSFDFKIIGFLKKLPQLPMIFGSGNFEDLIFIASIQNSKLKFFKGLWLNLIFPLILLGKFKFDKIIFINSYWVLLKSKTFLTNIPDF